MIKLTKTQADEIRHKLFIVAYEEPELREDHGLTEAQADELVNSVPVRGDWEIPAFGIKCVQEELESLANTRASQSQDLVSEKEYRKLRREMREFDSLSSDLGDLLSVGHVHQWHGNSCLVEGCTWHRAVPTKRKRTTIKIQSASTDGPESLQSLLRF